MKSLDLTDGIRATIYSIVVNALKNDPTLKTTIAPDGWNTYTGEDNNDAPPGQDTLPCIEVIPFGQGGGPGSMITQDSPFGIAVNITCDGADVRDLLNLWEAVERVVFTGDGQFTVLTKIRTALQALNRNAHASSINLTSPAITPNMRQLEASQQVLVAAGTILVNLRVPR